MMLTTVVELAALPAQMPDPAPIQPPNTGGFIAVMGMAKWVALAICGLAIVIAGARMAISHNRGDGGEHMGTLGKILMGVIIITGGVSILGFIIGS
ncbi:hypothetical protein [Leucobacter sp. UCMA 4100]|uniref:hypothetical protein n=1 Tax=Leucobacter sp. UCMA 4100 TaxID=2810534 RepID=UPI0022EA18D0|nr:hypothetical protein [Leucobacter sp. UCMA 4100]